MKLSMYWMLTALILVPLGTLAEPQAAISERLKDRYHTKNVQVSTNQRGESEGLFNIGGPLAVALTSKSLAAGAGTQRDIALATATQFLAENTDLFAANEKEFTLKKRINDKFGGQHFRFLRVIEGLPVADMEVIVHLDSNNKISGVNGNIVRPTQLLIDYMAQVNIDSLIDQAQALTLVSTLREEASAALRLLNGELLLFSTAPHIRWHLDVNSIAQVGRYSYWLNAETGELIDVKNTLRHPIPLIR